MLDTRESVFGTLRACPARLEVCPARVAESRDGFNDAGYRPTDEGRGTMGRARAQGGQRGALLNASCGFWQPHEALLAASAAPNASCGCWQPAPLPAQACTPLPLPFAPPRPMRHRAAEFPHLATLEPLEDPAPQTAGKRADAAPCRHEGTRRPRRPSATPYDARLSALRAARPAPSAPRGAAPLHGAGRGAAGACIGFWSGPGH